MILDGRLGNTTRHGAIFRSFAKPRRLEYRPGRSSAAGPADLVAVSGRIGRQDRVGPSIAQQGGRKEDCMSTTLFARFGALTIAASLWAGVAAGQTPFDKRTVFTFSGPVAFPGVTLPAGQYVFRLADPASHNVGQILSADGMKLYSTFYVLAAMRTEPSTVPEIRFMETAAGMPAAIRTWWYPGERRGYEFVYPKEQARLLAKGTGQPVLTTVAETAKPQEMAAPELARVAPSGEETRVAAAEPAPMAVTGRSQTGEVASATLPVPEQAQQARTQLPKTAGNAPGIALAGMLLLVGGAILSARRLVRQ
jgi:LPXTG-motif cell wall-anchored protein